MLCYKTVNIFFQSSRTNALSLSLPFAPICCEIWSTWTFSLFNHTMHCMTSGGLKQCSGECYSKLVPVWRRNQTRSGWWTWQLEVEAPVQRNEAAAALHTASLQTYRGCQRSRDIASPLDGLMDPRMSAQWSCPPLRRLA